MCEGLSNRFCLSFGQSVCPVKSKYKQSYTISKTDDSIDIVKKVTYVYLVGSNCNFCFSSTFLFNVVIIRHFNTVNILDMVESGYSLCTSLEAKLFFTLCFSKSFLLNVVIVRHFNMVILLGYVRVRVFADSVCNMVESGHCLYRCAD